MFVQVVLKLSHVHVEVTTRPFALANLAEPTKPAQAINRPNLHQKIHWLIQVKLAQ